ncbi:hypothetical protein ACI782_09650 [Geodermatophilus sp. SYSU D00703]
MSAVRRTVVLLVLTVAVIVGAPLPAQALFADTTAVATTVGTRTVQPPTGVRVDTECTTTTTVIEQTYTVNPGLGTTTRTSYSEARSTAPSNSNVESDTTTTTWTSAVDYTTTRTIKDTELYATGKWKASATPGVTGYRLAAILNNGWTYPLEDAGPTATTVTGHYDAEVVDLQARLAMVTLTSYGWTANSELSNVVTC